MVKDTEDTRLVLFKFIFLFLCVLLIFLLVFSFLEGFLLFLSVVYFFAEAYSFKNICQMEIFVTVYLQKEYLLRNV